MYNIDRMKNNIIIVMVFFLFTVFLVSVLMYLTYNSETFDALIENTNDKVIPKVIYRTGKSNYSDLQETIRNNIDNIVSTYKIPVKYFSDEDIISFIEMHYPQYISQYNVLKPKAYKADLWRLLYLYTYGGIYNDLTQVYIKSPQEIVRDDDELVLCTSCIAPEHHVYNAFIACYPKHPFIKQCIDDIIVNIDNRHYGDDMFDITGPTAIMKSFKLFFGHYPGLGTHEISGYKVKFFQEQCYNDDGFQSYIEDHEKNKLIQSRIDNHYSMLYNSMDDHYSRLWFNRDIYLN